MVDVLLYNSTVCRLCGEENENGSLLYTTDATGQNLSELINAYLPLKVYDDGMLPRTVCPGCAIQVEAAVEFLDLIIKGQKIIRELHQREIDYKKKSIKTEVITENIIYEINTNGQVYHVEHPISLQVAGVDKPKRKRGRPPKKHKTAEEVAQEEAEREREAVEVKEEKELQGKRRRKTPNRFREAVQGKELEKIFRDQGVIEAEESDPDARPDGARPEDKEPEVIGLMESFGELVEVVVVKGRKRGRPRGRIAQQEACGICGLTFTSLGRYMSHVAAHGPVRWECGCGELCDTRQLFTEHQRDSGHAGQRVIPLEQPVTTEHPTPTTPTTTEISETTPVTTEIENLPELVQVVQVTPAVPESVETVSTEVSNSLDNDDKLEDEETAVDVVTSIEGTDEFQSQDIPTIPSEPPEEEEQPATKGKRKLKCNHCEKLFSNKQSKSMHMKAVHAGERPYVCALCGAAFPYPRSLTLHALRHRRGERARGYACDLCGKVLNHPSSVVYHKEAQHANHQYVCLKCGKGFKHKQLLQRHQLVHSQLRPFSCLLCDSTFKTKPNLTNHQLLHSGERRFPCAQCPQRFAHKTSLTLHMRLHAGIKPYTCSECGKSFSQKGNLSEHARTHTGEKPYECNVCGRVFTTSSQRRLHARRHARPGPAPAPAPRPRPLRCAAAGCGRGFSDRAALLRHARRHHAPPGHKRQVKQLSLLALNPPPSPPAGEEAARAEEEEEAGAGAGEEVIYVTYEDELEDAEFHILDSEQNGSWKFKPSALEDGKVLSACEYYEDPVLMETRQETLLVQNQEALLVENQEPNQEEDQGTFLLENQELLESQEDPVYSLEENAETDHIAVTDEAGNPLHFTMQDGSRLAITSPDGRSLQVVTRDGRSIPVEIKGYGDQEEEAEEPAPASAEDSPVVHYFVV